jgi:hypothetical protein
VQWLNARGLLAGDESDFTPLLQRPESMEILGTALQLDELTAIRAEHNVLGKRLDIPATALDDNSDGVELG